MRPLHDSQIGPREGWPHHASTQQAFISQNSRAPLSRSAIGTSVLKTFAHDHGFRWTYERGIATTCKIQPRVRAGSERELPVATALSPRRISK